MSSPTKRSIKIVRQIHTELVKLSENSWLDTFLFLSSVLFLKKVRMQLQLIESDVCQHMTMRALSQFFHSDHLYEPGDIPIYIFLGILADSTDDSINFATRACFTYVQSRHMCAKKSFYVDKDDSIIGFIAFKTTTSAESDVFEFAKSEHHRMLVKIDEYHKRNAALQVLVNLGK